MFRKGLSQGPHGGVKVKPEVAPRSLYMQGGEIVDGDCRAKMYATNGNISAVGSSDQDPVLARAQMLWTPYIPFSAEDIEKGNPIPDAVAKLYKRGRDEFVAGLPGIPFAISREAAHKMEPFPEPDKAYHWQSATKHFTLTRDTSFMWLLNKIQSIYAEDYVGDFAPFKFLYVGYGALEGAGRSAHVDDKVILRLHKKILPGLTVKYNGREAKWIHPQIDIPNKQLLRIARYVSLMAVHLYAIHEGDPVNDDEKICLSYEDWVAYVVTVLFCHGSTFTVDVSRRFTISDIYEQLFNKIGKAVAEAYEGCGIFPGFLFLHFHLAWTLLRCPYMLADMELFLQGKNYAWQARSDFQAVLERMSQFPGIGTHSSPYLPMHRNYAADLMWWPCAVRPNEVCHIDPVTKLHVGSFTPIEVNHNETETELPDEPDTVKWIRFKDNSDYRIIRRTRNDGIAVIKFVHPVDPNGDQPQLSTWTMAMLANGESMLKDGYFMPGNLMAPDIMVTKRRHTATTPEGTLLEGESRVFVRPDGSKIEGNLTPGQPIADPTDLPVQPARGAVPRGNYAKKTTSGTKKTQVSDQPVTGGNPDAKSGAATAQSTDTK